MNRFLHKIIIFYIFFTHLAFATTLPAVTAPIPVNDLVGYEKYTPQVKKLIQEAYILSQKKLTYLYGSSDPKQGGMDCSGTIYYLLNMMQVPHPPRSSTELFKWAEKRGHLYRCLSTKLSHKKIKPLC